MKIICLFLLIAAISVFNLLVFTLLWDWFIVPIFALNPITLAQAFGLGLVQTLLFYETKNDDVEIEERVASSFVRSLVCLVFGYIAHFFV